MKIKHLKKYKIFKNEKLLNLDLLKNQGFCNINYLLKTSKKEYLIRVFKSDSTVNISREFEYKIQKKAYKKNIAAKPILLDEKNKLIICDFLKGKHKYKLKNKDIKELVKTIKKLHKIQTSQKTYDFKKDLKQYKKLLKDETSIKSIKICKKELKKVNLYKKEIVTTHHDLNPKNILFYKNRIKFIDWEYAGTNDLFFDLATICFEFKLNKKEKRIVLKSYLEKIDNESIKKLNSYILIYKNLCKLWFNLINKK